MKSPNLFHYATSELSQDAMICWLLSWAAPHCQAINPRLHECGQRLLRAFLKTKGIVPDSIESIEIKKQYKNIDVLCIVNGAYAVVIEDKTGTSSHGDQLERYRKTIESDSFHPTSIALIYYKTEDQSDYTKECDAGFTPFTRADILKELEPYADASPLLADYVEHLNAIETEIGAFRTTPIDKWEGRHWIGFYSAVKNELREGNWGYVANPSGGFWGFWCQWSGSFYVQLEEKKLCLKIETNNEKELLDSRWRFADRASEVAREMGSTFSKPARLGNGCWVTYSVYRGEYRTAGKDGCIDLAATVATIRQAGEIAKQLHLEHTSASDG